MIDEYGREISYLRVSLTDKCNLCCSYCTPRCGAGQLLYGDILSFEELCRIIMLFVGQGISKIRLTGGEPLVRKGMVSLVKQIKEIPGVNELAMTTNGVLLSMYARELREAGLDSVNISLDTLSPERFIKLSGMDSLNNVIFGIGAALSAGLKTKINCIPLNGINTDELTAIAAIAKNFPIDVRFIELMPIGCGKLYEGVSSNRVIELLIKYFGEPLYEETNVGSAAKYIGFNGFCGRIGFISPISHAFCDECNRLRITADGFLKPCLASADGVDLKSVLRSGADDSLILERIKDAVKKKPASHRFDDDISLENRRMVQIGG